MAANTTQVNFLFAFAPGQAINLALDWTGKPNPAPSAAECFVGLDPVGETQGWGHRSDPTIVKTSNSQTPVLVLHMTPRDLIGTDTGTITIKVTDAAGAITTTSFNVIQIPNDPCDE